jgi:hypothetical protein
VQSVRRTPGVAAVRAQLAGEPELAREFERLLQILGHG